MSYFQMLETIVMDKSIQLSTQDAYVLIRTFVSLSYDGISRCPIIGLRLANFDPKLPDDLQILYPMLGQKLMLEVLRIDTDALPPEILFQKSDLNIAHKPPEFSRFTLRGFWEI